MGPGACPRCLRILDLVANRKRAVSDLQRQLGITKANLSITKCAAHVCLRSGLALPNGFRLLVHRDLDDLLLDGVGDELRLVVDI
jgi:hypothetical protein